MFKSPAQRQHLNAHMPAGTRRFETRYGSDAMQATRKKGTKRRKGLLSYLGGGYRG